MDSVESPEGKQPYDCTLCDCDFDFNPVRFTLKSWPSEL